MLNASRRIPSAAPQLALFILYQFIQKNVSKIGDLRPETESKTLATVENLEGKDADQIQIVNFLL